MNPKTEAPRHRPRPPTMGCDLTPLPDRRATTPEAGGSGSSGGEGSSGGFRRPSAQARAHSAQAPPTSDFSKKCLSSQSPELRRLGRGGLGEYGALRDLPGHPALFPAPAASPLRTLQGPALSQSRVGPGRAGPPGRGR